jgi:glycerol uptake facilitator-like aquaporin
MMAKTRVLTRDRVSVDDPRRNGGTDLAAQQKVSHKGHGSRFWRHFLEMILAMVVGMLAAAAIFLSMLGVTWEEALIQYPVHSLLVVAAGMTVPMVAWMRHRGHGWRSCSEMAAAMVLPVIPFLCLVWFQATTSAQCGAYCISTILAMLGVMLYRRSEYAM